MSKVGVLLNRPDFRRSPATAIWKRLLWRVRWIVDSRPWVLSLDSGRRIAAPRGGSGALIYYQGASEPETADFIRSFLRSGMIFLDVGAHIGEYTILGSDAVQPNGRVHAFEPSPAIFPLLLENVDLNQLTNVEMHQTALSDSEGTSLFEICRESAVSSLHSTKGTPGSSSRAVVSSVQVATTTLDRWWRRLETSIDLIKIDVEGAELAVLRGARDLLALPASRSPVLVVEYSPENYGRFGYEGMQVMAALRDHGYELFQCSARLPLASVDFTRVPREGSINFVAAKSPRRLEEYLSLPRSRAARSAR
jgi:FkbM family methyltransferase